MKITINSTTLELPDNSTLQDALDSKQISPQGIATAVNGIVVPHTARSSTYLNEGDNILIIKAFYGG